MASVDISEQRAQAREKSRSALSMECRAYREQHAAETPGGRERLITAPSELRGKFETLNGRKVYQVEGYATVYNRGYEMWDFAGPYTEMVDPHALDVSLSKGPDVAFLVNHKGVTMARTRSGNGKSPTMTLRSDSTGLLVYAALNADRQDVQDLAHAVDDGDVSEMSFAFRIDNSAWNDEYTEFCILQADIDRGDASAVNYGANPFTSIAARSAQWLSDMDLLPAVVLREAIKRAAGMDDHEALFRDAARALAEASHDRYMRAAGDNAGAALRAVRHVEDDDLADVEQVEREQVEPASVNAVKLRLKTLGTTSYYQERLGA